MLSSHDLDTDSKTGLTIRRNTWDHGVVAEQKGYLPLGFQEGDIVLDIGANIGAFTWLALVHGKAEHVVAYEPDVENGQMFERNIFWNTDLAPRAEFVPAAVVRDEQHGKLIPFYINEEGTNKATHSTVYRRGRPHYKVEGRGWSEVVGTHPFTVVKIDIEGAEYDLPVWELPDTVRALAIEFHFGNEETKRIAEIFNGNIERAGFVPVKPFKLTPKPRAKMMLYSR